MRKDFRPGERVELVYTADEFTELMPGDRGTVLRSIEWGWGMTVCIAWDSGSTLSMLVDEGDVIKHVMKARPDNPLRSAI